MHVDFLKMTAGWPKFNRMHIRCVRSGS